MILKSLTLASAGLALLVSPIAASAAPAAKSARALSPSLRAGTPTTGKNALADGQSVIPFVIGAGIIAGVTYLIVDHEDKDDPDSN